MSDGGRTEVVELHLRVPPEEIAFVKFIFESYEGIAVVRTLDPAAAVIVVIVAADFASDARAILEAIRAEVAWTEVPPPSAVSSDGDS